jgi:hypothetical protein
MNASRRLYPLRSSSLAIRGWSLRSSPSASYAAPPPDPLTQMSKQPRTPVAKAKVWRDESPRPIDWSKMRLEEEIRKDLAEQLKEILANQGKRWNEPGR